MSDGADRRALDGAVGSLVGQRAWSPRLGVGSFLTLELGNPKPTSSPAAVVHGEYHLWVYCAAWRMDLRAEIVVASEDDRDVIAGAIGRLDGRTVAAARASPNFELTVAFDDGTTLRVFPIFSQGFEHWMLWVPAGQVYIAGPGATWTVESGQPVA